MKTLDFIKANIGNKVYLTNDRDLMFNGHLKMFIANKTPFTLKELTKGGMAVVVDINGVEHKVAPTNVREIGH